jgi:tetratricopeptide (TPR) repeat protein
MKKYFIRNMKLEQQIIMFLLVIVMSSANNYLFSQYVKTKPTRQSSFESFSKGNYEQAYKEFSELLLIYTRDPLYKYYSGVCLVNLKRDPDKAENFLNQALQGAAVVKTLPSDAYFYLGRARQMSGKYTEAMESFNVYTKQVGRKTAREKNTPEFIKQCKESTGVIVKTVIRQPEIFKNEKVEVSGTENNPAANDVVQQPNIKEPAPKINLPVSYEKILNEAIKFQFKADSINNLIVKQKKDLEILPEGEKSALGRKIRDNELLAASFQKSADQKYNEAQAAMMPQQVKPEQREVLQTTENATINDSFQRSNNEAVRVYEIKTDTLKKIIPSAAKQVDIFSYFEVMTNLGSDKGKIIMNGEVPDGLVYHIQMGVFSKPVSPSYFKGITPIYAFRVTGTENTIYYAGMFRRISDAGKALATVRSTGFKDAFIAALSGMARVSSERAVILEKEWGNKPFATISHSQSDTITPTLSFRVEVVRSVKPLKDDALEGIKKMAGNRGLDILKPDQGNTSYLIGKFITFESAAEYTDLLVRNGYREAKVVAFLGQKEIPVETAKQLVENRK